MQRLHVIRSPGFANSSFILKGIPNYFSRNIHTYLIGVEEDKVLILQYLNAVNLKKLSQPEQL